MSATGPLGLRGLPTADGLDQHGSTNPVLRMLAAGFERCLDELFTAAAAGSVLDVGCGTGALTERWASEADWRRVVGVDLHDPVLTGEWEHRSRANLEFRAVDVTGGLPFADREFDLVTAIAVLEHVAEPELVLAEMARGARSHLLVTVPREPLWQVLHVARRAYLGRLGKTPGHINHWTAHSFVRLLGRYGQIADVRTPVPWTMVLLDVSASVAPGPSDRIPPAAGPGATQGRPGVEGEIGEMPR